jgi:hypothetical protein
MLKGSLHGLLLQEPRSIYELAMGIMIGLSAVFGAALGLGFNVFVLIPALIVAALSAGLVELARGDQGGFVLLIIVFVVTAIQIGYLIGSIAAAAIEKLGTRGRKTGVVFNIRQYMEVVGSDGEHVGTVDYTESADRIVLSGNDPKARGKPHLISVNWVDHVDGKVHLNKPSRKAVSEWQIAA